jgi:hypothetical protein
VKVNIEGEQRGAVRENTKDKGLLRIAVPFLESRKLYLVLLRQSRLKPFPRVASEGRIKTFFCSTRDGEIISAHVRTFSPSLLNRLPSNWLVI